MAHRAKEQPGGGRSGRGDLVRGDPPGLRPGEGALHPRPERDDPNAQHARIHSPRPVAERRSPPAPHGARRPASTPPWPDGPGCTHAMPDTAFSWLISLEISVEGCHRERIIPHRRMAAAKGLSETRTIWSQVYQFSLYRNPSVSSDAMKRILANERSSAFRSSHLMRFKLPGSPTMRETSLKR
jgi:hypothetical protein